MREVEQEYEMTSQESQDYLKKLIESKGAGLEGLELESYKGLIKSEVDLHKLNQELAKAKNFINLASQESQILSGRIQSFSSLLLLAEKSRRLSVKQKTANAIQEAIDSGKVEVVKTIPQKKES